MTATYCFILAQLLKGREDNLSIENEWSIFTTTVVVPLPISPVSILKALINLMGFKFDYSC